MAASVKVQLDKTGFPGVSEREDPHDSDEALVRAAQRGDRSAFGILYQRYTRMVHGVLLARVPRATAEDLLQDVFLLALPRLSTLRDASRFGGWLAAIARNRANDYYRQAAPTAQLDEEQSQGLPESGRGTECAEGLFLLEAIRALPEAYREPLVLRFVEGMTGPEIAARTGMKHGSVRVNLCRGMEMLREKLGRR
jgi:RNA polymerase sigma-70 factor (ECF subfamily)